MSRRPTAMSLLARIDIGTTVLKVAVFDRDSGAVMSEAQAPLRVICGRRGIREYPRNGLSSALHCAVARLRKSLGQIWKRVEGLGVAAQGGSGTVADRETGIEKMPMMLWNDARSLLYLEEIRSLRPMDFWQDRLMTSWVPWGLGRIVWLKRERPALINPHRHIYAGAGECLFFHLTGIWRQDAGNAIQLGCYNARARTLDSVMLGLVGIPLSFVAPLRNGHEMGILKEDAARWLGLRRGIPVAGPYMDHEAGYLSCAEECFSPLQLSLGTAWVGNYRLPQDAVWSSPSQLVLPSPLGDPGWLVVQPLRTGNISWDWARGVFIGRRGKSGFVEAERTFRASLLPPPGVLAAPWLTRSNPFVDNEQGGGVISGLNPGTTRQDLLRALAVGMCCEMARIFQSVKAARIVDRLVLCGGASKSAAFQKLLAALFHPLPVFQPREPDLSGSRGCLYAFGMPMGKGRMLRCPPPRIVERIQAYASGYQKMFDSFFSREADLEAVKIDKCGSGRKAL